MLLCCVTNAECYVVTDVECHYAVYHQYSVSPMLSVIILSVTNAECHHAVSPMLSVITVCITNSECNHAVCHQRGVPLFCVLEVLSVIMLCATNDKCYAACHKC